MAKSLNESVPFRQLDLRPNWDQNLFGFFDLRKKPMLIASNRYFNEKMYTGHWAREAKENGWYLMTFAVGYPARTFDTLEPLKEVCNERFDNNQQFEEFVEKVRKNPGIGVEHTHMQSDLVGAPIFLSTVDGNFVIGI